MTETNAYGPQNTGDDYVAPPDEHRPGDADPAGRGRATPTATPCPPASVGEIWFKGPNLIRGYWNKPEATAETIVDGWLRTGDIGRIDDEGFVYVEDRAKDMVLRGGENVYCAEVEAAIYEHPAVYEAAVFGVPHERLGEEVAAAVVLRAGRDARPSTSCRPTCGERLAAVQGADRDRVRRRAAAPQRRRQDPQAGAARRLHRRRRLTPGHPGAGRRPLGGPPFVVRVTPHTPRRARALPCCSSAPTRTRRRRPTMPDGMDRFHAWMADLRAPRRAPAHEGLHPSATATTVRVRDGEVLLTDGPFAETKEQIGGFAIVECADLDEAIEIAAEPPGRRASAQVEIRPVWEA